MTLRASWESWSSAPKNVLREMLTSSVGAMAEAPAVRTLPSSMPISPKMAPATCTFSVTSAPAAETVQIRIRPDAMT